MHRGNQHELRGKSHRAGVAGDGDAAFLDGLAHGFQYAAFELGKFVEEDPPSTAVFGANRLKIRWKKSIDARNDVR